MNEIISGGSLSTYRCTSISINQAKKENRQGQKALFAVLTLKDEYSMGARPSRVPFFDEDLGEGTVATLAKYKLLDNNGNAVKDAKGGTIINVGSIAQIPDTDPDSYLKQLLRWPGAMCVNYPLRKGACYANDIDGNRTKDGQGNDVVKDTVRVFCQVKFWTQGPNGEQIPHYVEGLDPDTRGSRMEARFWREAVATQPLQEQPVENNPF